jgi:hypothetical protein
MNYSSTPGNAATFGIPTTSFKIGERTIHLQTEPLMDKSKAFPTPTAFFPDSTATGRFGKGVNRKFIGFSLDESNIKFGVMRPDAIYGGLQNNNQRNINLEAIMGDHCVAMRACHKHHVFDFTPRSGSTSELSNFY